MADILKQNTLGKVINRINDSFSNTYNNTKEHNAQALENHPKYSDVLEGLDPVTINTISNKILKDRSTQRIAERAFNNNQYYNEVARNSNVLRDSIIKSLLALKNNAYSTLQALKAFKTGTTALIEDARGLLSNHRQDQNSIQQNQEISMEQFSYIKTYFNPNQFKYDETVLNSLGNKLNAYIAILTHQSTTKQNKHNQEKLDDLLGTESHFANLLQTSSQTLAKIRAKYNTKQTALVGLTQYRPEGFNIDLASTLRVIAESEYDPFSAIRNDSEYTPINNNLDRSLQWSRSDYLAFYQRITNIVNNATANDDLANQISVTEETKELFARILNVQANTNFTLANGGFSEIVNRDKTIDHNYNYLVVKNLADKKVAPFCYFYVEGSNEEEKVDKTKEQNKSGSVSQKQMGKFAVANKFKLILKTPEQLKAEGIKVSYGLYHLLDKFDANVYFANVLKTDTDANPKQVILNAMTQATNPANTRKVQAENEEQSQINTPTPFQQFLKDTFKEEDSVDFLGRHFNRSFSLTRLQYSQPDTTHNEFNISKQVTIFNAFFKQLDNVIENIIDAENIRHPKHKFKVQTAKEYLLHYATGALNAKKFGYEVFKSNKQAEQDTTQGNAFTEKDLDIFASNDVASNSNNAIYLQVLRGIVLHKLDRPSSYVINSSDVLNAVYNIISSAMHDEFYQTASNKSFTQSRLDFIPYYTSKDMIRDDIEKYASVDNEPLLYTITNDVSKQLNQDLINVINKTAPNAISDYNERIKNGYSDTTNQIDIIIAKGNDDLLKDGTFSQISKDYDITKNNGNMAKNGVLNDNNEEEPDYVIDGLVTRNEVNTELEKNSRYLIHKREYEQASRRLKALEDKIHNMRYGGKFRAWLNRSKLGANSRLFKWFTIWTAKLADKIQNKKDKQAQELTDKELLQLKRTVDQSKARLDEVIQSLTVEISQKIAEKKRKKLAKAEKKAKKATETTKEQKLASQEQSLKEQNQIINDINYFANTNPHGELNKEIANNNLALINDNTGTNGIFISRKDEKAVVPYDFYTVDDTFNTNRVLGFISDDYIPRTNSPLLTVPNIFGPGSGSITLYPTDEAIVKLQQWKNEKPNPNDVNTSAEQKEEDRLGWRYKLLLNSKIIYKAPIEITNGTINGASPSKYLLHYSNSEVDFNDLQTMFRCYNQLVHDAFAKYPLINLPDLNKMANDNALNNYTRLRVTTKNAQNPSDSLLKPDKLLQLWIAGKLKSTDYSDPYLTVGTGYLKTNGTNMARAGVADSAVANSEVHADKELQSEFADTLQRDMLENYRNIVDSLGLTHTWIDDNAIIPEALDGVSALDEDPFLDNEKMFATKQHDENQYAYVLDVDKDYGIDVKRNPIFNYLQFLQNVFASSQDDFKNDLAKSKDRDVVRVTDILNVAHLGFKTYQTKTGLDYVTEDNLDLDLEPFVLCDNNTKTLMVDKNGYNLSVLGTRRYDDNGVEYFDINGKPLKNYQCDANGWLVIDGKRIFNAKEPLFERDENTSIYKIPLQTGLRIPNITKPGEFVNIRMPILTAPIFNKELVRKNFEVYRNATEQSFRDIKKKNYTPGPTPSNAMLLDALLTNDANGKIRGEYEWVVFRLKNDCRLNPADPRYNPDDVPIPYSLTDLPFPDGNLNFELYAKSHKEWAERINPEGKKWDVVEAEYYSIPAHKDTIYGKIYGLREYYLNPTAHLQEINEMLESLSDKGDQETKKANAKEFVQQRNNYAEAEEKIKKQNASLKKPKTSKKEEAVAQQPKPKKPENTTPSAIEIKLATKTKTKKAKEDVDGAKATIKRGRGRPKKVQVETTQTINNQPEQNKNSEDNKNQTARRKLAKNRILTNEILHKEMNDFIKANLALSVAKLKTGITLDDSDSLLMLQLATASPQLLNTKEIFAVYSNNLNIEKLKDKDGILDVNKVNVSFANILQPNDTDNYANSSLKDKNEVSSSLRDGIIQANLMSNNPFKVDLNKLDGANVSDAIDYDFNEPEDKLRTYFILSKAKPNQFSPWRPENLPYQYANKELQEVKDEINEKFGVEGYKYPQDPRIAPTQPSLNPSIIYNTAKANYKEASKTGDPLTSLFVKANNGQPIPLETASRIYPENMEVFRAITRGSNPDINALPEKIKDSLLKNAKESLLKRGVDLALILKDKDYVNELNGNTFVFKDTAEARTFLKQLQDNNDPTFAHLVSRASKFQGRTLNSNELDDLAKQITDTSNKLAYAPYSMKENMSAVKELPKEQQLISALALREIDAVVNGISKEIFKYLFSGYAQDKVRKQLARRGSASVELAELVNNNDELNNFLTNRASKRIKDTINTYMDINLKDASPDYKKAISAVGLATSLNAISSMFNFKSDTVYMPNAQLLDKLNWSNALRKEIERRVELESNNTDFARSKHFETAFEDNKESMSETLTHNKHLQNQVKPGSKLTK